MELEKALAWEVVAMYHGDAAADSAQGRFETIHQQRREPDDMPVVTIGRGSSIVDVLTRVEGVRSRSEARRLLAGRAVKLEGELVTDQDRVVDDDGLLQVGKRRFVRVRVEPVPSRPGS